MRKLIATVLASAVAAISILTFFNPEDVILKSPVSVTFTAGIAAAASIIVAAKHKINGLYGKTYLALAIGLACWFAGEMIWTYDNVIVGSPPSTISLAEVPWLMLYGFFGYYVFKTYRFFGYAVNKYHVMIVLAGVSLLMAVTTSSILNSLGASIGPEPLLLIRLLYPIGDAVLIVPSVLLLLTLRHGLITYTPWLFISVGLILIAAGDITFSNMSLLPTVDLSVVTFPLYNAGNLAFAAALIWYNRFGIYDQNKALNIFQEGNR